MLTMFCSIGSYKIPTWTSPLLACVFASVLIPNTSFLGHLCAVLVGYLREYYNLSYIRAHALTPHTISSWPRIPQGLCPAREDPPMDRRQAESPGKIAALCVSGSEDIWSLWRAPYCKPRGGSIDTLDLSGIYAASGKLGMMTFGLRVTCVHMNDNKNVYNCMIVKYNFEKYPEAL